MAFKWRKVSGDRPFGYDGIPGMDPAANWLLGPGKSAYLPGDYEDPMIPTLYSLQLPGTQKPPEEFEKIFGRACSSGIGTWPVRKSDLDNMANQGPGSRLFSFLCQFKFSIKFSTPHSQSPHLPAEFSELPSPPPAPPSGGWPDDTVVMAVIDDGICFAHEAFQDADEKTRIQYWWQQDGPEPDEIPNGTVGREIGKNAFEAGAETRDGIDDFMANANMDETDIYRAAGVVDFSLGRGSSAALRRSHGTHVLDVAAGYRRDDEENIKRPIIAVQLPSEIVEKSSGAELEFHVVKAVEYILHRARELKPEGAKLPVVITMSYGFIAGPHDGTTSLEVALKNRLEDYGDEAAQMILSAGNSHLSRCHAEFTIDSPLEPVELEWMVLPDDRTSSFLEIWLPYDSDVLPPGDCSPMVDDRIDVSVVAPNGQESGFVPGVQGDPVRFALNGSTAEIDAAAEIKYAFVTGETMRGMFRITLSPTEHLAGEPGGWAGHALAPAGVWRVRVRRNTLASDAVINAWIQRDDTIYGFPPRGRQSYFVSACYDRFDAQGRRTVEDKNSNQNCAIRRHNIGRWQPLHRPLLNHFTCLVHQYRKVSRIIR